MTRQLFRDLWACAVAVLTILFAALLAFGQQVTLPAEVKGAPGAWIIVAPEKVDGGKPRWRLDPGLQDVRLDLLLPPEQLATLRGKVVTASKPGRYRVEAWNAKGDIASEIATCWVVVGEPGPGPDPKPPDPKPPDPKPPAPIPADAFRVIMVMEAQSNMTREQINTLGSLKVRDYLDRKCVGGKAGWRKWDKDVDVKNEPELWRQLWDVTKPQVSAVPCVVIVNGTKGQIFPLPANEQALLDLLKQHGGD